ncbi:MAG: endolytic transglycosylase MltG [Spirulina sp. DLM2.Bin59]|nr:MAG: endolytic transglycosylase MltG [Spirulina sp. DLM2.Bin59]
MQKWGGWGKRGYTFLVLPGLLLLSSWQGYQWWRWAASPVAAVGSEAFAVQIEIPRNTSTRQIGADLAAAGVIRSAWAWNIWAFRLAIQDQNGSFKAGRYLLSPEKDLGAIAQTLWQGDVLQRSFTIPEGWRLTQIAQALEAQGYFSAAAFMTAAQTIPSDQFPWLDPEWATVEGFLYPDTYQLPAGAVTPQQLIAIMLNRFAEKALPLYEEQADPGQMSLLAWVTVASLVEKEAAVDEERGIIAGVFWRRLAQGMKLEADPTVEYILNRRQTPDRPLTFTEVATAHPYNTYVNPGLPPGPIASPGQASLRATLNPTATDYLFFVANYDGTHEFSRTLAEHQAAVRRIRAQRRGNRATP